MAGGKYWAEEHEASSSAWPVRAISIDQLYHANTLYGAVKVDGNNFCQSLSKSYGLEDDYYSTEVDALSLTHSTRSCCFPFMRESASQKSSAIGRMFSFAGSNPFDLCLYSYPKNLPNWKVKLQKPFKVSLHPAGARTFKVCSRCVVLWGWKFIA